MKKKIFLTVLIVVLFLAVLFVPIPKSPYRDGGTREYSALTYKIVCWNRLTTDGVHNPAKVYWFPNNFKSIDDLWVYEEQEMAKNLRHKEYTGQWLDKETAQKHDNNIFDHIVITEIYSNCFFATPVIPMPYTIKLNGHLSEDWCVGDQITCTYENTYYDDKNHKVEVDFLTVEPSDWEPEPGVAYKPVIYLYPETETDVSVKLILDGKLICTYPAYNTGWKVNAAPDGTLTDAKGQTYNYLYWEGQTNAQWDMTEGFCVKGEETAAFLEEALAKLGLNRREANEFIVYWLPLMERNPYNMISFQTDIYAHAAQLQIDPEPDTLIRVFMAWKAADALAELPEQELATPERNGFTVVEWGGTELK